MPADIDIDSETWDEALKACREKQTDATLAILHALADAARELGNQDLQYVLAMAIENLGKPAREPTSPRSRGVGPMA